MPSRLIARASATPAAIPPLSVPELEIEAFAELPGALSCRPSGIIGPEKVAALNEAIVAALGDTGSYCCSIRAYRGPRPRGRRPAGRVTKVFEGGAGDLILVGIRPKLLGFWKPWDSGIFLLFPGSSSRGLSIFKGEARHLFQSRLLARPVGAPGAARPGKKPLPRLSSRADGSRRRHSGTRLSAKDSAQGWAPLTAKPRGEKQWRLYPKLRAISFDLGISYQELPRRLAHRGRVERYAQIGG
jgi:hypothetical protein